MARYQKKLPPPDLTAAKSWVGKPIRDAYKNRLGLVIGVEEKKDGIYLLARFPGQKRNRRIALHPKENNEYIFPGAVKARYRPPSDNDVRRLATLSSRSV